MRAPQYAGQGVLLGEQAPRPWPAAGPPAQLEQMYLNEGLYGIRVLRHYVEWFPVGRGQWEQRWVYVVDTNAPEMRRRQ